MLVGLTALIGQTAYDGDPEQDIVDICNRERGHLTGYDCPDCLNRGYFVRLKDGNRVNVECRCMETRRGLKRLRESGLENLMSRYTLDTWQEAEEWHSKALQMVRGYIDTPSGWMVACGSVGAGKSHLCTAAAVELLKQGRSTRYAVWPDFAAKVKGVANFAEDYEAMIAPMKRAEVVYIDDFLKTGKGVEPTPADIRLAFEIINARYNDDGKITIISTELTLGRITELDEALGSRIYERAKQGCYLPLKGKKNWRTK